MKTPVIWMLLSGAVFVAMILNLAAKPKFTKGLIGIFSLVAGIGGLVFYGLGFAAVISDPLLAVVKTLMAVSRMYAGVNDFGSISAAPIVSTQAGITIFWVLHLMAFYAMASATISALGASALKRLKFWLQRYGKSIIIYGINSDTVDFARDLIDNGAKNIVFVGDKPEKTFETAASEAGCLVRSDSDALKPGLKLLKSLGSHKGTPDLTLYGLDSDAEKNLSYASELLHALEEAEVNTERVKLVIRSNDDSVECGLAAAPGHYGYGSVLNFTDSSLAGRLLMTAMPPCKKMSFTPEGTATGAFDAIVIGFGHTGRSVLRNLVRNAQFEGSHFRAAVFSTNTENRNGYFFSSYPDLVDRYDISFHENDARSLAFYNYVQEHCGTLRYIVICTGNGDTDSEIRSELTSYLTAIGCSAAICSCSGKSVFFSETPGAPLRKATVLSHSNICADNMDRLASVLNYSYVNDSSLTATEAWNRCDYFSRESSRASADFLPAFLRISGLPENSSLEDWRTLSPALLENMAKTEHLRWCAFHYSMGFSSMDDDTVRRRGEKHLAMKTAGDGSPIRICKDLPGRRHACLREWDELEALSRLEESYTGVYTDYKDMDLRNVLSVPLILKESRK